MDEKREVIRHLLAALAYRTVRALENAPPDFATYDGAGKQPVQILAHMGDLFEWALSVAQGSEKWRQATPLTWTEEQQRFFAALGAFDTYLASPAEMGVPLERLLQGPIADALTHVGQLAMMRRMAGSPTRGENFVRAEVKAGAVGPEQPGPEQTF